jgi:hypothetical protein
MAKPRDPFDVSLPAEAKERLGVWVCDQITDAENARAAQLRDVDYWWTLYEQARTRTGKNAPWPDAADLTSYLASEKVDALHARIMRTVFGVDPVWTVEGWGDAAARSPIVEEFHQWKLEEERLQSVVDKLVLQALVEPRGLLEIAEGTEIRAVRKTVKAALELHPETGGAIFDQSGNPVLQYGADGKVIEVTDEQTPSAETVLDSPELVRTGPIYRLLPYRDSLITPGHARDADEITGYWKRFWRRLDWLDAKADAGAYDDEAVDRIAKVSDRESTPSLDRAQMSVAPSEYGRTEVELWEGVILLDLAEWAESFGMKTRDTALKGERWYLVTVHVPTHQLLRVQFDDMERSRFVPVILFPRHDRATEGYSFVGHKLITTIEEHTAVRNMKADRSAMANRAPIKRLQGALYDPQEQPWGPGSIIDVRDMRELEPMIVNDVTPAMMQWESSIERTAERLAGINDVASGQVATETRTLGEVQMATEQSFVRMDLIVKRFQESMEDIAQIRHAIWKRTLSEREDGEDAPAALVQNLEGRGVSIDSSLPDGKITAAMLDGAFRFKPHGSVENADPNRRRNDMIGMLQALPMLAQAFPMLQGMFNTPQAARAMGREFLRNFHAQNTQAFLGSVSQDLDAQQMLNMLPPGSPMPMPPMGGMPPGMPGMGGPPPGMPPGAPPPMPPIGGPQGAPPVA